MINERRNRAYSALRRLDSSTTALLLVDMQVDYASADGFFARQGVDISPIRAIVPALVAVLNGFRARGMAIFHTQYTYIDGYPDIIDSHRVVGALFEGMDSRRCVRGTKGVEFIPELAPTRTEIVVRKPMILSGFLGTELEVVLRKRGIASLLIGGVATQACVLATCSDAFGRDFDVMVIEDGVATYQDSLQESVIHLTDMLYGPPVLVAEILDWLGIHDQ